MKCGFEIKKDGVKGCNTSAGFLSCNICGIKSVPKEIYDDFAKQISDAIDKEILSDNKVLGDVFRRPGRNHSPHGHGPSSSRRSRKNK